MRKAKTGFLLWLTNHLTYPEKYLFAGLVRAIGFIILWGYLFYLVTSETGEIRYEMKVAEVEKRLSALLAGEVMGLSEKDLQLKLADAKTTAELLFGEDEREEWNLLERALSEGKRGEFLTAVQGLSEKFLNRSLAKYKPEISSYLKLEEMQAAIRSDQTLMRAAEHLSGKEEDSRNQELEALSNEIALSSANLSLYLDFVKEAIGKDRKLEAKLKAVTRSGEQYKIASEQLLFNISENIQSKKPIDASLAISTSYLLWDHINETLRAILEDQKYLIWKQLALVFALGAFFAILGSYLGVHFVYEAIKCFQDLDHASRRLKAGELDVRVPILYHEEIGHASEAFNQMAAEMQKVITQQRLLLEATLEVSKGDLSRRVTIPEDADEELKAVSLSFNAMVATFEELVKRLHRLGGNLAFSTGEIHSASKRQERMMTEQEEATREIAITSGQISTTAKDFANTINDVSQVADQASNLASEGQDSLIKMEQLMRQMVAASESISGRLNVLSEKTRHVNKVQATITNVARQTKLLALNAYIESKKAGPYSREFLAIAEEIHRLSNQTAIASTDIEQIISEIAVAVHSSVDGVKDFSRDIYMGGKQVADVSEGLGKIIIQVQTLAYRFEFVNSGMQKQSLSASEINAGMAELADLATATSSSLKQFQNTISELTLSAGDLSKVIQSVKTL